MSRIGWTALLLLVTSPAAGAEVAPAPAPAEGVTRSYGVAYEYTRLATEWGIAPTVNTAQGRDSVTADLLAGTPGFQVLRAWIGRRNWLGPNAGFEALLSLGYGHAFERRSTLAGTLGSYPLAASFDLYDVQGLSRLFLFRRMLYVELGLLWQRVVSSATLAVGDSTIDLGRREDFIGGAAGLGAELTVSAGWRVGVALAAAGFIKLPGPFPTRTQLRLYLTW